jgi:hypothetical protein
LFIEFEGILNQFFMNLAATVPIVHSTPHAIEIPNFGTHLMPFVLTMLCHPRPIIRSSSIVLFRDVIPEIFSISNISISTIHGVM